MLRGTPFIQLFRQTLSHKTYAYATTPTDSHCLLLFYLRARCFSKKGTPREGGMRSCVCAVSSIMLKHLAASIKTLKARITHNNFRHCRVRLYAFVGQPFSKQLYLPLLSLRRDSPSNRPRLSLSELVAQSAE